MCLKSLTSFWYAECAVKRKTDNIEYFIQHRNGVKWIECMRERGREKKKWWGKVARWCWRGLWFTVRVNRLNERLMNRQPLEVLNRSASAHSGGRWSSLQMQASSTFEVLMHSEWTVGNDKGVAVQVATPLTHCCYTFLELPNKFTRFVITQINIQQMTSTQIQPER